MKTNFDTWMQLVDRAILARCGLTNRDLTDCDYWSMWEDGLSPASAARQAIREQDM